MTGANANMHPYTLEVRPNPRSQGTWQWAIRRHGKLVQRSDRTHSSEAKALASGDEGIKKSLHDSDDRTGEASNGLHQGSRGASDKSKARLALRTTNPIESAFTTVRHLNMQTKCALAPITAKLTVFKLVMATSKNWQRLKGDNRLPKVVADVILRDKTEIIACTDYCAASPPLSL